MDKKLQIIVEMVDKASAELKKISKSIWWLGDKAKYSKTEFAAAWAAIVWTLGAIGGKSMAVFSDFEHTMSGVKAVLTPTQKEFEILSQKARELWKATKYSATESASAIEVLAKNWLNASQIMGGAVDASLSLAAATGADLATAADIATDAMLSFWKWTKDLEQVVNSITWVTNQSKFSINDYALAMAQGGGVAATVWMNLEDFNASIAAISPLFKSWSDAGTSFKTMLLRLVPQGEGAGLAMKELWLITKDWQNQFFKANWELEDMVIISERLKNAVKDLSDEEKNRYLNTIFGTDAMRAAAWIAGVWAEKFTKLTKAIEWTNAAKNASTRIDNLKWSLEILKSATEEIMIVMWTSLQPVMRKLVETAIAVANGIWFLIEKFGKLPQPLQQVLKIFGGVVVWWTALAWISAVLSVTLGGVAAAFSAIIAAAAPWLVLVTAISASLYTLYLAWDSNFLGIKDTVIFTFNIIKEVVDTFWAERWPLFQNALTNTFNFWKTTWDWIYFILKNAFEVLLKPILERFLTAISFIFQNILEITKNVWGMISWFFQLTFGNIILLFKTFLQLLWWDRQGAFETLKTICADSWEAIKQIFISFYNVLLNITKFARESVKTTILFIFEWLKTALAVVWEGIINLLIFNFNAVVSIASDVFEIVKDTIIEKFEAVKAPIEAVITRTQEKIERIWKKIRSVKNAIWNAVKDAWNAVKDTAGQAWNAVSSAAWNVWKSLGFRADGWPVSAWSPYIVGEQWPELFVPKRNGTIIPNGANTGVNVSINMGGVSVYNQADEERLVNKLQNELIKQLKFYNLGVN